MNIVKKNGYYHLQFTFKKEGKTVSKEKYLGKSIPKNIEQIKEEFLRKVQGETLFRKLDKIKENYQKEWKRYPESIKKKIKEELTISFTYNTNAIEGSTITLEETRELIERKISPNKPIGDVQETVNHAKIFSGIMEDKYKELSLNLIKQWHKDIFKASKSDIAGKIRDYLVKVGGHIFPDWQDLPKLLKDLFNWYENEKDKLHPIELAAKAHYRFVTIHPFGDGNGRISRLIMDYILIKNKFPILIIEYKKRASYYKALKKAQKNKSEWEFLKYFYRRYLSYHKGYLNK
tara:strand:- start:181 stop:1050 length:870 start_codon:yes stop_codon:yes gene_type:complete